jgi:FTR1 family protein
MRQSERARFWRIAAAGVFLQGGAAAVDTSTIVATLVHALTGSSFAVGAAAAIARFGWLFPQLIVGWMAQRRRRRTPFYMVGALGRVVCLVGVAGLIGLAGDRLGVGLTAGFFLLWTAYAFVSGIVAVPYNDIVGRTIASAHRSRMLAIRFFGGGLLALAVAGIADRLLADLPFPGGYAAVLGLGAILLLISALSFISAGEPEAPPVVDGQRRFMDFLRDGVAIVRIDRRFRLFLYAQWLSGAVAMALPFYILQVTTVQSGPSSVALLLGVQTMGSLVSNPLWGWWGDLRGKRALLEAVAAISMLAPLLMLAWLAIGGGAALAWFAALDGLFGDAEAALDPHQATPWSSFFAAFTVLLREALEALLIVVVMLTLLRKAGRQDVEVYIHGGWISALGAGALTWAAATYLISISGAGRELTEGFGSLLAAFILLWVGIWMHGKSQADAWQRYIRDKLGHALSRRSAWGLFGLSFLVVYREVFETILFYAAIWNEENAGAVLAGAGAAIVGLMVIAWALMRYGRALPVGKFFAYSSALLAVLCIVLMGKGISALQEAGWLPISPLSGFISVDILGLYPTAESISAQVAMAALILIGFWNNQRRISAGRNDEHR